MKHLKKKILAAMATNQDCEIRDPLREQRVLITEHGPMSYDNDKELVALVAQWPESSLWLGHILRLNLAEISPAQAGKGEWVALIVQACAYPRGSTKQEVFEALKDGFQFRGYSEPSYCLHPDDSLRLCHTFEEVCSGLVEMIERFDAVLMGDYTLDDRDYIPPRYLGAKLDMRIMDIYGLPCLEEVQKADKDAAAKRSLKMAMGEGWIEEVRRLQALKAKENEK